MFHLPTSFGGTSGRFGPLHTGDVAMRTPIPRLAKSSGSTTSSITRSRPPTPSSSSAATTQSSPNEERSCSSRATHSPRLLGRQRAINGRLWKEPKPTFSPGWPSIAACLPIASSSRRSTNTGENVGSPATCSQNGGSSHTSHPCAEALHGAARVRHVPRIWPECRAGHPRRASVPRLPRRYAHESAHAGRRHRRDGRRPAAHPDFYPARGSRFRRRSRERLGAYERGRGRVRGAPREMDARGASAPGPHATDNRQSRCRPGPKRTRPAS